MLLKKLHEPIYQKRINVLSNLITRHLRPKDKILDIGSGSGALGKAILEHPGCPPEVKLLGLEKFRRGNEDIETIEFDGHIIPVGNEDYEITILADVVHHEENPERLVKEAVRVTRRCLIVKDHTPRGFLGYSRTCILDWAANNPYGVKCLYRYLSIDEWRENFRKLNLTIVEELTTIDLYPFFFNYIFGKKLQYFAVLFKQSDPKGRGFGEGYA